MNAKNLKYFYKQHSSIHKNLNKTSSDDDVTVDI